MITAIKYISSYKEVWDNFVQTTRQQSILFNRNYIEYHHDRFNDHSLIFLQGKDIIAVLPANKNNHTLYSHQGLTFGGLLYPSHVKSSQVIEIITVLLSYLKKNNFQKLVYKPSPGVYHNLYSDEDIYAFYQLSKFELTHVEMSTAISPNYRGKVSKVRKRGIKKALNHNINIKKDALYLDRFYDVLSLCLEQNHKVKPVHTKKELLKLMSSFPENIHLWVALAQDNKVIAGIIVYDSQTVSHFQYIASTPNGKQCGAIDLLLETSISYYLSKEKNVEFGKSTENNGTLLNKGLVYQKESFGGSAINYNTYTITLEN